MVGQVPNILHEGIQRLGWTSRMSLSECFRLILCVTVAIVQLLLLSRVKALPRPDCQFSSAIFNLTCSKHRYGRSHSKRKNMSISSWVQTDHPRTGTPCATSNSMCNRRSSSIHLSLASQSEAGTNVVSQAPQSSQAGQTLHEYLWIFVNK